MRTIIFLFSLSLISVATASAQMDKFNGLNMNMGNLFRLSDAKTRSIRPENFTGGKGKGGMADPAVKEKHNVANAHHAARDLGQGWKARLNFLWMAIPASRRFTEPGRKIISVDRIISKTG